MMRYVGVAPDNSQHASLPKSILLVELRYHKSRGLLDIDFDQLAHQGFLVFFSIKRPKAFTNLQEEISAGENSLDNSF